jgi:hypothetical protein
MAQVKLSNDAKLNGQDSATLRSTSAVVADEHKTEVPPPSVDMVQAVSAWYAPLVVNSGVLLFWSLLLHAICAPAEALPMGSPVSACKG